MNAYTDKGRTIYYNYAGSIKGTSATLAPCGAQQGIRHCEDDEGGRGSLMKLESEELKN